MTPEYVDAHCHLADPRFAGDLPAILARAGAAGVGRFIQGGVGPEDWDRQVALARAHPGVILTCFGLHPWWVAARSDAEVDGGLADLGRRLRSPGSAEALGAGPVALGELGLDFGPRADSASRPRQLRAFRAQLALARLASPAWPLVLHVVKAHAEARRELAAAAGAAGQGLSGIVHAFTGSPAQARAYLELGLAISVGGSLARAGFENLKKAVQSVPSDRLVLETDSPDLPPPGEAWAARNEPAALLAVAAAAGRLRGEAPEAVLEASRRNLVRIFRLESPA